jgi:MtrB/PioB family decaheme-associated outer membrane protein
MRLCIIASVACCLSLAAPRRAQAQSRTPPPGLISGDPVAATDAPAAPQAPAPPAASPVPDDTRSLFDETGNQFQIGGRASHIDGDPARFQRYQDLRNGVLFTNARLSREDPGGLWQYRVTADNVGYRDQKYTGIYERTGRFVITGLWDEIPQFYSVDTKTPYTMTGSPLRLDDATQRLIQNGQATLSAYIPIAPQFDLRERRDIGNFNVVATPTPQIDVKGSFTTTRHTGELPWGGSFGFSNDVEVALPYDSRTNDLNIGTEWANSRSMLRVAYDGSWFNNLDPTLVWDSPLALTDASGKPGTGQMQLWPTNSAQTISGAGYTKFAHKTQLTGAISYGFWNQDQPLLPFTSNTALPTIALPRASAQAEAHVFSGNLNLVSHPRPDWEFTGRLREYDYNNQTPATTITDYVSYDSSISQSSTNGPRLYAHNRTTFDGDATYSGLRPVALSVGYTYNGTGYDSRIFDHSSENGLRLAADAVGSSFMTLHAKYEYSSRTGSGLNEALLTQIGEHPEMRYYDLANRNRNQFTGIVDFVPNDMWTLSVSGGVGKDNYPDSYFGLQETTFRTFSTGADFHLPNGFGGGGTYNFERYSGLQQSRSSDSSTFDDPTRNWTTDTAETVNYFSLYATPPRIGRNTEARVSYDFSYAEGSYVYGIVPGGPLPAPSQLPNVYNKLQQLHVDVRHRLSHKLALNFAWLYEPFRVYDFAFDPSVVNSIVQPSSLVLGYVYRPYTANSFNFGLKYFW